MTWSNARVVVAVAVGLLVAGCDQPGAATPPESITDLVTGTQPAGTPLGDGFVVAENSALIGDVYPYLEPQRPDIRPVSGWTAQMVVLADPIGVFNDYARQALDLGYDMRGGCRVHDGHTVDEGQSRAVPLPLAGYRGDDPRLVTCGAGIYLLSDREPPDILRLDVGLCFGEWYGAPIATVSVAFAKVGDGSGDPYPSPHGPPFEEITDPMPPLPTVPVPELPVSGEPIAPHLSQRSAHLVVPPEATLAALPLPPTRWSEPGWDAILLTSDVAAVLDDLEEQTSSRWSVTRTVERRGDTTYTSFLADFAGDGDVVVVGVDHGRGGTVLVAAG